jgi:hypothetical protein
VQLHHTLMQQQQETSQLHRYRCSVPRLKQQLSEKNVLTSLEKGMPCASVVQYTNSTQLSCVCCDAGHSAPCQKPPAPTCTCWVPPFWHSLAQ